MYVSSSLYYLYYMLLPCFPLYNHNVLSPAPKPPRLTQFIIVIGHFTCNLHLSNGNKNIVSLLVYALFVFLIFLRFLTLAFFFILFLFLFLFFLLLFSFAVIGKFAFGLGQSAVYANFWTLAPYMENSRSLHMYMFCDEEWEKAKTMYTCVEKVKVQDKRT